MTTTAQPFTKFKTRPESPADLPDYERRGNTIAQLVGLEHCLAHPTVGRALLDLVDAAKTAGLQVEDDGTISFALTDDQLAARLTAAQERWDGTRDDYLQALADPASLEEWKRRSVDSWVRREGLDAIAWPA